LIGEVHPLIFYLRLTFHCLSHFLPRFSSIYFNAYSTSRFSSNSGPIFMMEPNRSGSKLILLCVIYM
jgi:hypothetical protein